MAGKKILECPVIGEYKLHSSSVIMSLDSTGEQVLLASKHAFKIVNLSSPQRPLKYLRKNVKWEVNAAQWNPHKCAQSTFVVTRNDVAELYVCSDGRVAPLSTQQSHTRAITDLDWSPFNSNVLLTCSADGYTFLWDTRTNSSPPEMFETPQICSASQVKWNKVNEPIFATSHDRDIRIWDIRRKDRPIYISGHFKKIHGLDWSVHNSNVLATASEDETVKFWDYSLSPPQHYNVGELTSRTHSPMWKARFAPFENRLVTIDVSQLRNKGDNCLMLWNIEDYKNPELQFTFFGHTDVVTEFQWRRAPSDNQYQLITWSRDNTLRLCKYETSGSPKAVDLQIVERRASQESIKTEPISLPKNPNNMERRLAPHHVLEDDDGEDESSQDELVGSAKTSGSRREAAPTSPNVHVNTLQNEFRSLSTIRDVHVQFDLAHRRCLVTIANKGDHRIGMYITFPDNYPEGEPPKFRFDGCTTIDKALQAKLVTKMADTASPLIDNNKVCVEKCIYKLRNSIDDLESKNSLDIDVRLQSAAAQSQYTKNIPYPRTCGATFCNDRLITFQRPVHPATQLTPRSFHDWQHSIGPHSSRSRSNFYASQISRSPKESMLTAQFFKRHRAKLREKKEKSGPVFIYDVSSLLPVNRGMAIEYRLDPSAETCKHNAEVAAKYGRKDLHQVWKVLEEFMDERLNADPNTLARVPWAYLPLGRPMIKSMLRHYGTIGDFQTLSMIVSMFNYESSQPQPVERPLACLQRSSSNLKIFGTSPATSLSGRSPPDKSYLNSLKTNSYQTIHLSDSKFLEEWNSLRRKVKKTPRWRADSHNGSLQDMRSPHLMDPEVEMQKHKSYTQILESSKGYYFDLFKTTYADQLYRWSLLDVRATLLKSIRLEPDNSVIGLTCGECNGIYNESCCPCRRAPALQCALCRSGVKGNAILCFHCGHGGHVQHMRMWFETDYQCATGCGCHCLEYNAIEY